MRLPLPDFPLALPRRLPADLLLRLVLERPLGDEGPQSVARQLSRSCEPYTSLDSSPRSDARSRLSWLGELRESASANSAAWISFSQKDSGTPAWDIILVHARMSVAARDAGVRSNTACELRQGHAARPPGMPHPRCAPTCGICDLSSIPASDLRSCPVCQEYLCLSIQQGPRSVCEGCILSNLDGLERIFVHGKDARGNWLDPGTLQGIRTCRYCGAPEVGMRCGPVIGCFLTPGTSAPTVRRLTLAGFRARLTGLPTQCTSGKPS